jgi:hypothetical protein
VLRRDLPFECAGLPETIAMTLRHVLITLASCCTALSGCAAPRAVNSIAAIPAEGAVVPLTVENFLPVVEVAAGDKTLRLALDLGGTDALSLSQSAASDLDVEWTGRHRFVLDAFGRLWRGREFIVPEVTIADLTLHGVRGYEIPDSRFQIPGMDGDVMQLDGYIGVDLLNKFNVLVDYPNGRLVLLDHAAAPPGGVDDWPGTPFTFDRKGVVSRIMLDGRPIVANWDTGATHTVIRPDRALPHWPRWQRGPQEAVTAESLAIGGAELGAFNLVLLDFRQPRVDVIIGTNLFEQRAVWFDFAGKRLAVDPRPARRE